MIRNPKDFGVWPACPSGVHSVITTLEMLPSWNPDLFSFDDVDDLPAPFDQLSGHPPPMTRSQGIDDIL